MGSASSSYSSPPSCPVDPNLGCSPAGWRIGAKVSQQSRAKTCSETCAKGLRRKEEELSPHPSVSWLKSSFGGRQGFCHHLLHSLPHSSIHWRCLCPGSIPSPQSQCQKWTNEVSWENVGSRGGRNSNGCQKVAERDAIICWRTAVCITILKPPNADSYLLSSPSYKWRN